MNRSPSPSAVSNDNKGKDRVLAEGRASSRPGTPPLLLEGSDNGADTSATDAQQMVASRPGCGDLEERLHAPALHKEAQAAGADDLFFFPPNDLTLDRSSRPLRTLRSPVPVRSLPIFLNFFRLF